MRRICETAEASISYPDLFQATYANAMMQLERTYGMSPPEMVCSSAVRAATDSAASLVVVLPEAVNAVDPVAKYRPQVPIMALDYTHPGSKDLSLLRGVVPVAVTDHGPGEAPTRGLKFAMEKAKRMGMVRAGDLAVVVGSNYGNGESLNFDFVDVL
jgi:pyruvate kinase